MEFETKLIEILRREGKPLPAEDLFRELQDQDETAAAISRLLSTGRILMTRKKKLALPEQTGLIYGRIQGHARGYGFFIPEDGSPDAFLPADAMHGAMHGDKVWVRLTEQVSRNGSPEAEVALIAVRAYKRIVGTFECDRTGAYVVPDETRIPEDLLVMDADTGGAKMGDKVVAEILAYPDGRRPMTGRVTEVLGNKRDAGTDVLSIVRQYDLPESFSKAALRQAKACKAPDTDAILRREDLRNLDIITIDGADAKDLDDAVSFAPLKGGNLLLGVHIADVSHYVLPNTQLDKEAQERGTSVYLLDRVLPMLPPEISNGVCSLNEGEDKLTLSCIMEVTPEGRVVDHRLAETVIRTRHRMTYDDVNAMLSGDAALMEKYADVLPMLQGMDALREKLYEKRVKRGSIDFDIDEAQIELDHEGRPLDVRVHERGRAERLIEEFMLLANETVAQHLSDLERPCMYRVHETPDKEKVTELNTFLQTLGLGFKNLRDVQPRTFQKILLSVKGTPEESIVSRMALRSLKKARYSEQCLGHFGLAAKYYCHFTSPIRRYPDLMVHRIIKLLLHGKLDEVCSAKLTAELPEIARLSSERERVAMEAERAVDDLKKCQFMKSRIGMVEEGIISGVASFGFFVELPNTVEGVVRLMALTDDHYIVEEKHHRIVGRNTKKVFCMGDKVSVRVANVNLEARTVDFELTGKKVANVRKISQNMALASAAKKGAKAEKKPGSSQKSTKKGSGKDKGISRRTSGAKDAFHKEKGVEKHA